MKSKAFFHQLNHLFSKASQILLVFVVALSMLLSGWHPVSAADITYYVDNTNESCSDSGAGTTSLLPFCTIGKGATEARAGDTVHVLAGTYAETVNGDFSGTAGSPITYSAAPGVTVTGNGLVGGNAFRMSGKSYIVVDGFSITDTVDYGIYVSGSNNITISNNHVSNSGDPVSGSTRAGIYINSTIDSTISGNISDHNSNHGIHLTNGCENIMVSDNIAFANAQQWQRNANGIRLDASNNNTILHNITYANEDSGLNFYTGSSLNLVLGNVIYGNGDHGIDFNAAPNNTVIGNTVQGNVTVGINFEGATAPGSGGATVANNIMVDNGLLYLAGGGTSAGSPGNLRVDTRSFEGMNFDYNIFYLNSGTVQITWNGTDYASLANFKTAVSGQETHGLQANPLFTAPAPIAERNPTAPYWVDINEGDYHLTTGSPAIDSANSDAPSEPTHDIEGHARVDDPATLDTGAGTRTYDDRGAYEFQPSGLTIAPTVTTQAVNNIAQTSATGNGNVTALGVPNPTQHGVVWNTASNPTIALTTKTAQGAVGATGAFTSVISGLAPGTLYHVRAYATNAAGTSYGTDVNFTTLPATTETFSTSGSWTAPAGVTSVTVEVWGGGGKGGNRSSSGNGGGGGGGAYSISTNIPVTPGNSYAYAVGAGATGTSAGGDSYFINNTTLLAKGGNSVANDTATGASGGASASGVGDTKYSGGTGATGAGSYGGGGGSSAGTAANGTTATNATGATAPSGGGNGGDGRSGSSGNGSAGSVPGGAGGGAYRTTSGGSPTGGNGADGRVRITYSVVVKSTSTSVNCGAGTPTVLYGSSIACVATVTASSGTTSPSGTVSWTTNGTGSFDTSSCTLSGTGGTATCSVTYTPSSVGTGSHLITASYAGNSNFLTSNYGQTVTVNKVVASVTPNAASKIYGDVDPALTGLLTGFLPADSVTAAYSRIAGETVAEGPYEINAVLSPAGVLSNYDITYNTAAFTITPKPITVTADAGQSKVFGAVDPTFTFTSSDPAVIFTGALNRAIGENVGPYAIGQGTLANTNYTITFVPANFTITPQPITVTADAGQSKVFGAVDPTFTFTSSDPAVIFTGALNRAIGENVGPYAIGQGTLANTNYTITFVPANFTITPKPITVTADAGQSKVFGAVDPTFTFTSSDPAAIFTGALNRAIGENVGPYAIGQGTLANTNYTITFVPANFTITPQPITVTADAGQSKVFGAVDPTFTFTSSDPAVIFTGALNRAIGENVGPYAIGQGTLANTNYTITFVPANFTITPKPITVTADAGQSKVFGAVDPTFTFTSSDPAAIFTGALNRAIGENVGPYAIGQGTLANTNYTITFVPANFTITPKPITVTAVTSNKTYDGTTSSSGVPTITFGNLVGTDSATWTQTFDTKNVGTGKTLTPAGSVSDGNGGANYAVTFTPVSTGEITTRPITVTAVTSSKTYDGTTSSSGVPTITFGNLVGTDSATWTQTFDTKNVGTGKTLTPAGSVSDGNGGANYAVTFTPVSTGVITTRPITVTAVTSSKTYDGTTSSSGVPTITFGNLVGTDSAAWTQTFDTKNVGTGKTLTPAGSASDGNGGANYAVTFTPVSTGEITKANQTITVSTHAPAMAGNGSTFTVAATSDSGLAVSYSASGACTNVGATFTMTSGTSSCLVQYDQDGDSNYNPASQVVETVLGSNAPVITLQPVNAIVKMGGDATFSADANGDPTPTVIWQVSTDGGALFTDMPGETSRTLIIVTPPLANNGYQYRAVFTNGGGSVPTNPATLSLLYYVGYLPIISK